MRLINIGSKHEDVAATLSFRVGDTGDVNKSKVRSLALLEEHSKYVSELIPSWPGEQRSITSLVRSTKYTDENQGRQDTDQSLSQLRKALRELGGRKVQREAELSCISRPASPTKVLCDTAHSLYCSS